MSGFSEFDFSEPEGPPPTVQWQSWPLGESFPAAAMALGGLLAAGAGVRWITAQTHLALLAVGVMAIALWRFFLPRSFELSPDGVNHWLFGRHRRIPWREIRRYEVCSFGVLLLPVEEGCPIDSFRGLYLPWGKYRAEVLAQVHYYLDRTAGP